MEDKIKKQIDSWTQDMRVSAETCLSRASVLSVRVTAVGLKNGEWKCGMSEDFATKAVLILIAGVFVISVVRVISMLLGVK
jgi:hypothetical protein